MTDDRRGRTIGGYSSRMWVMVAHIVVIGGLVLSGLVTSCRRERLELMRVGLVELPVPDPAPAPVPPSPTPSPAPTPPQPNPAPARPTWHRRSAAEIRRSAHLSQPAPTRRTTPATPVNPATIANRLQASVRATSPSPAAVTGQAGTPGRERYIQAVSRVLREAWDQPSRAEVQGNDPAVAVELDVAASGTVTVARLTRRSGVRAMDTSVQTAIGRVKRLPPFREYGLDARSLHIDINFELD